MNPAGLRLATYMFLGAGVVFILPLSLVFRKSEFQKSALPFGLAAAFFWGALGAIFVFGFWDLYYRYFYPEWLRWLTALDALVYAVAGLAMWWLAGRLPGPSPLWFGFFGGLEGVGEHLLGILGFGILQQVPFLGALNPSAVLVFAFCEYFLSWTIVGWIAFGLARIVRSFV